MADRERRSDPSKKRKNTEYRFPEGKIAHVGPYGVNEKDPALYGMECYERDRRKAVRKAEQKRRKKRQFVIILVSVLAVLLVAGGCFAAFTIFGGDKDAEEVAPVSGEISTPEEDVAATEPEPEPEEEIPAVTDSAEQGPEFSYTMVINRSYPLSDEARSYVSSHLVSIEGKQMEEQAGAALARMVADMRAEGLSIIIQSGYRTASDQEYLYNRQIGRQGGNEYKAGTISAVPGTSEHEAGLAVDLSVDGSLTEAFGSTPQGQWLAAHCMEYGFILRYPSNTEFTYDTGIISEPWHFRYVGSAEEATKISKSGTSMEAYYGKMLKPEHIDPYKAYLQ